MRKRMVTKLTAVIVTATLVVSMVTGCGKSSKKNTDTTADDPVATQDVNTDDTKTEDTKEAESGYTDYSNGFKEQVTIQIPVYDRAFEGWNVTDNYYTKWIQSEFGDKYNVKVQYVAIGRTTEVQDYMQMIAAGNAPDIIMHYDMPQAVNYYNEGAIQDLDLEEIAYYAPDYYGKLKDTIEKYGKLDGKNAFFFAEREAIYYNWVTLIRQDWLDQVGKAMPTNRAELEDVARAWKEAGLGTLGETLLTKSFTYEYPFIAADTSTTDLAKYLDLNVAPFTWDASKQYLQTLNAEYNEGLIDPEFYLNKEDADAKADFVAGKTGTYGFYINSTTDVISSLLANDPNAKVATMNTGAGSPDGKGYYYEYPAYGMVMGINSTTSKEERAAIWLFLNWMIQDDNLFYLQNGIEGTNYTKNADGIAEPVADFNGESKLSNNNNKDYWCLVQEVANYGDEELNFKANLKILAPAGYESLIQDAYDYYKQNAEYGLITPIFTKSIESVSEYSADLNAMWQEFYVDCVTCSPDEFESKYASYCDEYLDCGYQEILDEKQELLDAGEYLSE
ncbi:type 2 periplasmic-binding domain-containing protein [Anaerosporobacter faecicola]|uniref:extracellular solute-binding protein n=1 Tax=Anaerosporobacter faecicola TaxID=2718714 RepID=UPI00143B256F|nr:extracellular solute-binding protein [Anaerosporobacter faecicola]